MFCGQIQASRVKSLKEKLTGDAQTALTTWLPGARGRTGDALAEEVGILPGQAKPATGEDHG